MGEILDYWKKCFNKGKKKGIEKREKKKEKTQGDNNV